MQSPGLEPHAKWLMQPLELSVRWFQTHLLSLNTNLPYKFLIRFSSVLLNEFLMGINNILLFLSSRKYYWITWSMRKKNHLSAVGPVRSGQSLGKGRRGHRKQKWRVASGYEWPTPAWLPRRKKCQEFSFLISISHLSLTSHWHR